MDVARIEGTRPRRPRDEEGHPCLHRVRRRGGGAAAADEAPAEPEAAASSRGRDTAARTGRAHGAAEPQPGETIEPMTAMRKGIAEHMRRSLDTSAHVTTTFEVDMSKVVAIREKLKKEYAEKHGVKLTYLPFIARATVDAIGKWPWMNAELRGDSIVVKSYVNLGHRRRARGRQGPDRPGRQERGGEEPARAGAGDHRRRRPGAHEEAHAGRRPGRHVHDHEPGRVRRHPRDADHQPAPGRHPRRRGARRSARSSSRTRPGTTSSPSGR